MTVFKGGPVLIDAQPRNRRFQRLAGSPSFAAAPDGLENQPIAPGDSSFDIDGVEGMATVQKSDINP